MHAISFAIKRLQHRTLAIARRLLKGLVLTPARFDMLYALAHHGNRRLLQSKLRRILGVSAPTVCRMAQSLESLGLIRREQDMLDKRQRIVWLTDLGSYFLVYCIREVADAMSFMLTLAIGVDWYLDSAFVDLLEFADIVHRIRRSMNDTALLDYPWHPDA